MEVTSTLTLQNQSSSLMVSCLLPDRSWFPGSSAHPNCSDLGTTPEHPYSHWEGGRGLFLWVLCFCFSPLSRVMGRAGIAGQW